MLFKWFSRLLHTIVFLAFIFIFSHIFAPMLAEATPIPNVFINEIHYDNYGIDQNEFIEIAGVAGLNLVGWSLHFYNGSNGKKYNKEYYTFTDWLLKDSSDGFGFASVYISGIQNGAPDGVVLADDLDNIIQFLSYEGSFTASSGIATGLTSTDIGVWETSDTPVDFSLQLIGAGQQYSDFAWASPQQSTFGGVNIQQSFAVNESYTVQVSEPNSSWLFFLAFFIFYFVTLEVKQIKEILV